MRTKLHPMVRTIADREEFRDHYGQHRDPIYRDRLLWRAQSFRHMVHLLPGQTILQIGAGSNVFTTHLLHVSRGENPITAVTFLPDAIAASGTQGPVEYIRADSLEEAIGGRTFDLIIGMDVLDEVNCCWLLQNAYKLLNPGGQIVFYESNPWNIVLRMRRFAARAFGSRDPRRLLSRPRLYELLSEIGFTKILALYNDFVYAPLNRPMVWIFRNLSILLENLPVFQTLAGSILLFAQKPGGLSPRPSASLAKHECLRNAVSVVVPCHNEEMNVQPLVSRLIGLYGEYLHEIILVDDNSTDDTAGAIRSLMTQHGFVRGVFRKPPNGVGRALADGFRVASGQYVLSMDCDFTHLLPELRDLFDAAANGHDMVVGSRFSRHSVLLNYPFQKIAANRGFHVLAQLVFHRHFRDLTNNLKLLKREVVESLSLSEPHFSVNAETGLQPLLMGFSVCEVPISWINRTPDMGTSSFRLAQVGGGYWRVLLRLALRTRFGFRSLQRSSPPQQQQSTVMASR
jgi:dolichol-phosphate mannosyltransferase